MSTNLLFLDFASNLDGECMYFKPRKSRITDWWIAESNLKMAFVNIFSEEVLSKELLIVGYLDKEKQQLATSTNKVVEITKDGVMTAKGTFYPFEEAHYLYLSFLIEVNTRNSLIATKWEYKSESSKKILVADIIRNGNVKEGVTFDFIPSKKYNVMLKGYSISLCSHVILTTFSRRNVCILLCIPPEIRSDILRSSYATKEEKMEKVRIAQNIYEEKLQ